MRGPLTALTFSAALCAARPGFSQEPFEEQVEDDYPTVSCSDFTDESGMAELEAEYDVPFDQEQTAREVEKLTQWFQTTYNLEVTFLDGEFMSPSRNLMCPFAGNDLMKLAYLRELKKHVLKYPPQMLNTVGVERVRFSQRIHDLKRGDQSAGYVMRESGYVNLVVVWPFNHEVFHKIDMFLDRMGCAPERIGIGNERCDRIAEADASWGALDSHDPEATGRWDEEQAEMGRILLNLDDPEMTRKQYNPLLERRGSRRQLRMVKHWLYEASDGAWDRRFWKDLAHGRVDENSWEGMPPASHEEHIIY